MITDKKKKLYYEIDKGRLFVANGSGKYNRPLFVPETSARAIAGDSPIFGLTFGNAGGKVGTLRIGIIGTAGAKWFDTFADIKAWYDPGWMTYELADQCLGNGKADLEIVPQIGTPGLSVRLRFKNILEGSRLIWAFGGSSGGDNFGFEPARYEREHSSGDRAEILTDGFVVSGWREKWADRLRAGFNEESKITGYLKVYGRCDLPGTYCVTDGVMLLIPLSLPQQMDTKYPVVAYTSEPLSTEVVCHITLSNDPDTVPGEALHDEAQKYYRQVRETIRIRTPDVQLNTALACRLVEMEGCWDGEAFMHGNWSWMGPYLGWRHLYGPICMGMTERIKKNANAHAAQQVTEGENRGALPHFIGDKGVYYNMNEVFLHQTEYYYRYTGDLDNLRSLYPVLAGIVQWEKRRLDIDNSGLFENCLNTWISDSHWYWGGGCTQASSYMYSAYRFLSHLAKSLKEDRTEWDREAEKTYRALQERLWITREGHYAEYVDKLGERLLHPDPELASVYHPAECGTSDPFQTYQAIDFVLRSFPQEHVTASDGKLVWSSRWTPNRNWDYMHSTYDLVDAENTHLALVAARCGWEELTQEILRGSTVEAFMPGMPGTACCHITREAGQRMNPGFSDSASMYIRSIVEGLFGIVPQLAPGEVAINPALPFSWHKASIETPFVAYTFSRKENLDQLIIEKMSFQKAKIHLPCRMGAVAKAIRNGEEIEPLFLEGIGHPLLETVLEGPGTVEVLYEEKNLPDRLDLRVSPGENIEVGIPDYRILSCRDPQGVLTGYDVTDGRFRAGTILTEGHYLFFLQLALGNTTFWQPVRLTLTSAIVAENPVVSISDRTFSVDLVNPLDHAVHVEIEGDLFGASVRKKLNLKPRGRQRLKEDMSEDFVLLPGWERGVLHSYGEWYGTIPVRFLVETGAGDTPSTVVWYPVEIPFNESIGEIFNRKYSKPRPSYPIGFDYCLEHYTGGRKTGSDDSLLREQVAEDGLVHTGFGIPFRQVNQRANVLCVSRWANHPTEVKLPIGLRGDRLYILMVGTTSPNQCYIPNGELVIRYADGFEERVSLDHPGRFDDSLNKYFGSFHYADNLGIIIGKDGPLPENINEPASLVLTPRPEDRRTIPTHADILDLPLRKGVVAEALIVSVKANEVIIGIAGVTVARVLR